MQYITMYVSSFRKITLIIIDNIHENLQCPKCCSWETYMQVRKQQLEMDVEQQTGSK